jgi:glutamyl-Q tRNA(Asp) synthetase
LGHAYSALLAFDLAQKAGGDFLLRIEDIDQSRARARWEAQIYDDLAWLGISWPHPVMRQSERRPAYTQALTQLRGLGVVYPCYCSRRDIQMAVSAPQEGAEPALGPDGLIYPGTCRDRPSDNAGKEAHALRLDMAKALHLIGNEPLEFVEQGAGKPQTNVLSAAEAINRIGDVVLARRDMGTSYHLSVVVDDAAQAVTHVVRGADLFEATKIHVVLQALLGLPTPVYHHHRLIRDETGKRLAKRDDARAIAKYRQEGKSPGDIRRLVGLTA